MFSLKDSVALKQNKKISPFPNVRKFSYSEALCCQTQFLRYLQIAGNTAVFAHLCFVRVRIVRTDGG